MTKQELEQLTDLKQEIEELEKNIAKIKQMDIKEVSIKVSASSKSFPYAQSRTSEIGFCVKRECCFAIGRNRQQKRKGVLYNI